MLSAFFLPWLQTHKWWSLHKEPADQTKLMMLKKPHPLDQARWSISLTDQSVNRWLLLATWSSDNTFCKWIRHTWWESLTTTVQPMQWAGNCWMCLCLWGLHDAWDLFAFFFAEFTIVGSRHYSVAYCCGVEEEKNKKQRYPFFQNPRIMSNWKQWCWMEKWPYAKRSAIILQTKACMGCHHISLSTISESPPPLP